MWKRGFSGGVVCLMLALSPGSNWSEAGAAFSLRASSAVGSLSASPSFASVGVDTSVTVTGAGWITFFEPCRYDLLFDGEKKFP
jgi:hypothetical protein